MKEPYLGDLFKDNVVYADFDRMGIALRNKDQKNIFRKTALIVLDMQRYFLCGSSHAYIPDAPIIIHQIKQLSRFFRSRGFPIVYTRHLNNQSDAGMMGRWWRDIITADDPASEIIPELEVLEKDILNKTQYDAFYKTSLNAMLKEWKVETVIVSGVMTHLCCETTARSAFVHGYGVIFLSDATATYNVDFHRATLINLAHGFASVMTTADLIQAFTKEGT